MDDFTKMNDQELEEAYQEAALDVADAMQRLSSAFSLDNVTYSEVEEELKGFLERRVRIWNERRQRVQAARERAAS